MCLTARLTDREKYFLREIIFAKFIYYGIKNVEQK